MTKRINLTQVMTSADVAAMEKNIKPYTVNASELGDMCSRYHYYACQHRDQYLCSLIMASNLKITFEVGRALENLVRKNFLQKHPITRVLANWVIRPDIPIQREDMINKQWNHELQTFEECEFRLGHPDNTLADFREVRYSGLVTGRVDWMYLDDNGKITVTEIKTISKTEFEILKNPKGIHAVQGLSYIRLATEDGRIAKLGFGINLWAKLFYISKDFRVRSEEEKATRESPMYKEYDIEFVEYKAIMSERWNEAKIATTACKENKVPEKRLCKTYLKGRGKACPFMCRCFMGD